MAVRLVSGENVCAVGSTTTRKHPRAFAQTPSRKRTTRYRRCTAPLPRGLHLLNAVCGGRAVVVTAVDEEFEMIDVFLILSIKTKGSQKSAK